MNAAELICELHGRGYRLVIGGPSFLEAAADNLDPTFIAALRAHRDELFAYAVAEQLRVCNRRLSKGRCHSCGAPASEHYPTLAAR